MKKGYTMCRPNGELIGVNENHVEESGSMSVIEDGECEAGKRLSWITVKLIWKSCYLEEMLMRSKLRLMLEVEGHQTHKASVVCLMFSGNPKSTDRLRHVLEFSKHVERCCPRGTVKMKPFMLMILCVHSCRQNLVFH